MTDHASSQLLSKILFGIVLAVVAAIAGYLIVYWWVFRGFNDVLNVNALKSQIIATQQANDVKTQLKDLGYQFQESDFYQLNNPASTNYRANVLQGYEPEPIENEEVEENGYYFYDESGIAYYFSVDENNQVDPDSLIPLIAE